MSDSPENPNLNTDLQSNPALNLEPKSELALTPPPDRDPAWNAWDVLALVGVMIIALFALELLSVALLPGASFQARLNKLVGMPELQLAIQAVAELVLLACMYLIVAARTRGAEFWKSVHWNWPAGFGGYLLLGVLVQFVFLLGARFLPFPRNTPFELVLKRPYSLVAIAAFSVTLGPLMEELFFRGFLYQVLRRPFGVATAILGTAIPFGLLHAAQYGYSWASVLLVTLVGVVLATVRERKQSLAASFLVHVAYNSVIVVILFIGTDGFRHLEKLGSQ